MSLQHLEQLRRYYQSSEEDDQSDNSTVFGEGDSSSGVDDNNVQENEQEKQEAELQHIVKSEDKAVFWLRMALIGVLFVSAIVCALLLHNYSSHEEQQAFLAQFESDAPKLFESIGTNLENTMSAADAFMFQIISQAKSTNAVWPFVLIPDLPVKAAKLLSQTDSIYMAFYPLIAGEQRMEWENFTRSNDGWVQDSLDVQSRNPNFHGPILEDYDISHTIWRNEGPESYENQGPFLPSWMGSPVIPYYYPYNWNGLAYEAFAKGLVTGMETKSVVVTAVANSADPNDQQAVDQAATTSDWAIPYLDPSEDPNEPFADMYYPVIDSIDDVLIKVTEDTKALGSVAFSFYWRHTLKDSLPPNSKGVTIVFENPCGNQVFTYQIDGKLPIFLGFQDLHDPRYHHQGVTSNLTSITNVMGQYTGLPLNDQFCPYKLTIYPSRKMEEIFVTSDPVVYAIVVAFIFLFTSLLFLSYDWFVNRRQALMKQRALASGAIVSSLFPEQVRSQLYEDTAVAKKGHGQHQQNRHGDTPKQGGGPLGSSKSDFYNSSLDGSANFVSHSGGSPNAHLYEGTTIFFADIVGFTSWSAKRTPVEVFELLEALYGEFDKIAVKRGIFKVETIGDCYVAATGIPKAQPLHAVNMVKFAQEALEKMHVVTQDLAGKLGEDTMDLGMRVGINSGSTTAGVLRGNKGRFQLFGDTVNTAARMESTGVPNRIQVSETTADELIKRGKRSWLTIRKDTVNAKGKGEMQTYFATVRRNNKTTSSGDETETLAESSRSGTGPRRRSSSTDDMMQQSAEDLNASAATQQSIPHFTLTGNGSWTHVEV